jgi:hypothetical protein
VPIGLIYERWVSKYVQNWTAALVGLKRVTNLAGGKDLGDDPARAEEWPRGNQLRRNPVERWPTPHRVLASSWFG